MRLVLAAQHAAPLGPAQSFPLLDNFVSIVLQTGRNNLLQLTLQTLRTHTPLRIFRHRPVRQLLAPTLPLRIALHRRIASAASRFHTLPFPPNPWSVKNQLVFFVPTAALSPTETNI